MNSRTLALIAAIMFALACGGPKKPPPAQIDFIMDFTAASKLAAELDRPMIIDFFTDWCKWCDSLDANTYVDSLVIGMSVDIVFVKINAEVDTGLAGSFGISGYPTIVITRPDGSEIDRIWGYLGPIEFYNQVQLYLQGKETLDDYLTRLEDEPENAEYLSNIAEKYTSRGRFPEALRCYDKIIVLDPDNDEGRKIKALESAYDVKSRAGDYAGAIETCRRIAGEFPESEYSENAEAMIAYFTGRNGDNEQALKLYREYLKKYPRGENAEWVKKRAADLEDSK